MLEIYLLYAWNVPVIYLRFYQIPNFTNFSKKSKVTNYSKWYLSWCRRFNCRQISYSQLECKSLFYKLKDFNFINQIYIRFLVWHVGSFYVENLCWHNLQKLSYLLLFIPYFFSNLFCGRWSLKKLFWFLDQIPEPIYIWFLCCMLLSFL